MAPTLVQTFSSVSGAGAKASTVGPFDFWAWTLVTVPDYVSRSPVSATRNIVYPAGRQHPIFTDSLISLTFPASAIELMQRIDAGVERPTPQKAPPGFQFTNVAHWIAPGWVLDLTFWTY